MAWRWDIANGRGKYCSVACASAHLPGRTPTVGKIACVCQHCGKVVERFPSQAIKYCSKSCRAKDKTGPESPRWGKPGVCPSHKVIRTCPICGKQFQRKRSRIMYGEGHYCSHTCCNIARRAVDGAQRSRARLNRWDYRHWRTAVFERDHYTCQRCDARGRMLNAHHIKPWRDYPELRFEVANGLTLCAECHRKEHCSR